MRCQCRRHMFHPAQAEILGPAEVGFAQPTGLLAVGVPVLAAVPIFAPCGERAGVAREVEGSMCEVRQPAQPLVAAHRRAPLALALPPAQPTVAADGCRTIGSGPWWHTRRPYLLAQVTHHHYS